jgi:N-sulfoglucosamine sulfohydrolase
MSKPSITATRRAFLTQTAAVGALTVAGCATTPRRDLPARPNLVLFVGDDHDLYFTGCYGNNHVRTPHLDRLAAEGLRFTNAFTATAMCTPSRSMLYTGLFPHRNGAHPNHSTVREGVRTLPSYLQDLGYRVALAGKTHVKPPEQFAFEYLERDEVDAWLAEVAGQPFCLIIGSKEPHTPHATGGYDAARVPVPPFLVDTPETRQRIADYCTDVSLMDDEIGEILSQLDARGIDDNTLFIYASDHGAPLPFGKWTLYDSGLRVPVVARWPGVIRPGTVTDGMIQFVDVLPTFIELVGGTPPSDLDGRAFTHLLTRPRRGHHDRIYGAHTHEGVRNGGTYPSRAVRTERWKYIVNLTPENAFTNNITAGWRGFDLMWNSWQEKAKTDEFAAERTRLYQHRPLEELFDIQRDPFELNSRAEESHLRRTKKRLRAELRAWMVQQNDPRLPDLDKHFA